MNQNFLKDLVRDLNLTKENSELLGSRLKELYLLEKYVIFSWYRSREKEFLEFFSQYELFVFYKDIIGLMKQFGIKNYKANELFINSSKISLKAVLLYNGSKYASIPITHSVHLKKNYENFVLLLKHIKRTTNTSGLFVEILK